MTRNQVVGSEVSDENGIFRQAHAWINCEDESPAIAIGSCYLNPKQVKLMKPEDRDKYLSIVEQINKLRQDLQVLELTTFTNNEPITWNWMKQHQKAETKTPEPFKAKSEISNLRQGSKVIISTTNSAWHRWVGVVGRIRRFGPKYAVIVTKDRGSIRVPYPYLKPYNPETRIKAKDDKRSAEMGAKIVGEFNKILR